MMHDTPKVWVFWILKTLARRQAWCHALSFFIVWGHDETHTEPIARWVLLVCLDFILVSKIRNLPWVKLGFVYKWWAGFSGIICVGGASEPFRRKNVLLIDSSAWLRHLWLLWKLVRVGETPIRKERSVMVFGYGHFMDTSSLAFQIRVVKIR